MKAMRILFLWAAMMCLSQINGAAMACTACFGQSDSPMAKGLNAGVFALLAVIGMVLAGAATFFVFMARRASTVAKQENGKI
jgi:hypothetical protein